MQGLSFWGYEESQFLLVSVNTKRTQHTLHLKCSLCAKTYILKPRNNRKFCCCCLQKASSWQCDSPTLKKKDTKFWGRSFTLHHCLGECLWQEEICLVCSALLFNSQQRGFVFQATLSSLHTTRFHASAKGSSSGHLRGSKELQEDQDVKCHCHKKASRTPSADSSCPETNSIQEFAESFEKQLRLKSKRSVSLVGNNQHKIATHKKNPKTNQPSQLHPLCIYCDFAGGSVEINSNWIFSYYVVSNYYK